MSYKVAISGFGRIGRNALRAIVERNEDFDVVAINDLAEPEVNTHLLKYDSTHGMFRESVGYEDGFLRVGSRRIRVLQERDPRSLPWGELGVDCVIESTGLFTSRDKAAMHLDAGAHKVVISAPGTDVDGTFVMGVNDADYEDSRHHVISNASCTTNCLVPMASVLDRAFGIEQGFMTTAHAYTNDQNLLDLAHRDLRRARAAAINIVPASTGAARATSLVLPQLKGKLDGVALRVPVADGSITDLTAIVGAKVTVNDVNEVFREASSSGPLVGILDYSLEPLVSSDIIGRPVSCTFDSGLTMGMSLGDGRTLVKVFGWYDNEWGYTNRLVDLVGLVARKAVRSA